LSRKKKRIRTKLVYILSPVGFAARHVAVVSMFPFIMSRWLLSCLDVYVSPRSAQINGISDMMPAGSVGPYRADPSNAESKVVYLLIVSILYRNVCTIVLL
jgi:hypothetical protein